MDWWEGHGKHTVMVCQERRQREANRIHCRETRLRKRGLEHKLIKEAEALKIYRDIVERGPDLFSCHGCSCDAPFMFISDSFQERLKLAQHEILDLPLAVIVDPNDSLLLKTAVGKVLEDHEAIAKAQEDGGRIGGVQGGSLVYLRVGWGGVLFSASMTITIGTQGMIVVTRLYEELVVP